MLDDNSIHMPSESCVNSLPVSAPDRIACRTLRIGKIKMNASKIILILIISSFVLQVARAGFIADQREKLAEEIRKRARAQAEAMIWDYFEEFIINRLGKLSKILIIRLQLCVLFMVN